MVPADHNDCYKIAGKALKMGNTTDFDEDAAGYTSNAADTTSYSEWVKVGGRGQRGCYEVLWTGNSSSDINVEAAMSGPPVVVNLDETPVGPDTGNAHTGDISAADPSGQDLGVCLVNLSGMAFGKHRVRIGNSVGTGSHKVRFRSTEG